ncbi:unnamed protein product [Symbiodinium sp. CCMP2592]|nr:unnamed protein product [Symbiodinium sp. CCMP2592]
MACRCAVPLLAAALGCLLGPLVHGRPPVSSRPQQQHMDTIAENNEGSDAGGDWGEPQPEPASDPYHQWNSQWTAGQTDLGSGQWSPTWSWTSWSTWEPSSDRDGNLGPGQWSPTWAWSSWGEQHGSGADAGQGPLDVIEGGIMTGGMTTGTTGNNTTNGMTHGGMATEDMMYRENMELQLHIEDTLIQNTIDLLTVLTDEEKGVKVTTSGCLAGVVVLLFYPLNVVPVGSIVLAIGLIGLVPTGKNAGKEGGAQWFDGTFRPAAFRRAQADGAGVTVDNDLRDYFRELLQRADNRGPPSGSGGASGQGSRDGDPQRHMVHQVRSTTGDGTWTSPWWSADEWREWGRAQCRNMGFDGSHFAVDWSGPGLPEIEHYVNMLRVGTTSFCRPSWTMTSTTSSTTSASSTTSSGTSSSQSSRASFPSSSGDERADGTLESVEDEVAMMQTGATGRARDGDDEEARGHNRSGDEDEQGSNATIRDDQEQPPAQSFQLTADERDELMELGWDSGVVDDLREFLLYLEDIRERAGVEAVSWALGQWAHSLILSEATLDLVHDILFRRVGGENEQRPEDLGMRGRLCVGFAGFQKVLGAFHLQLVQRLLQDVWLQAADVGDPPYLPAPGMMIAQNTNTAAVALETARARARAMVERARQRQRGGEHADAGDVPTRGARGSDDPAPTNDNGDNEDVSAEGDATIMMQLTPAEENELDELGVCDELRGALRELLRGLEQQEQRDVGAEYRWGVQQVLDAASSAHIVAQGMERILGARVRPSAVMCSYPSQRVPPYGALRSRVASWMSEFQFLVVKSFEKELESALRELTGCPPGSLEMVGPLEDGVGHSRATRDAPRGSRSRSRSTRRPGAAATQRGERPPAAEPVANAAPPALPQPPVLPVRAALPPEEPAVCPASSSGGDRPTMPLPPTVGSSPDLGMENNAEATVSAVPQGDGGHAPDDPRDEGVPPVAGADAGLQVRAALPGPAVPPVPGEPPRAEQDPAGLQVRAALPDAALAPVPGEPPRTERDPYEGRVGIHKKSLSEG